MTGPEPGPNYTPTFSMPIIGPAPDPLSAPAHYAGLANVGMTARMDDPNTLRRLTIGVENRYRDLLAMHGGKLRYRPPGTRILEGQAETTANSALVLQTWPVDAQTIKRRLPGGMAAPREVIYLDVDAASVRTALDVEALWSLIPRAWLEHIWQVRMGAAPTTATTTAQLRSNYLDAMMLGEARFFVPGGTVIGQARSTTGTRCEFTLRFTNASGNALSPVPYIKLMPSDTAPGSSTSFVYGGARWDGHPLIVATEGMPIPVDIYLKFEIYDLTTNSFVPLPSAASIELVDFDSLSDDVLATTNPDAQDVVHFGFARQEDLYSRDTDEGGAPPDIFFRARLSGVSTPFAGHERLPETWSTKGWLSVDDEEGYYPLFRGTQIGAASAPMVFRVGLDYHIKLQYKSDTYNTRTLLPAPPGLQVGVTPSPSGDRDETNADGEVHGVTFDVGPETDVAFMIRFRTSAADSIHLGAAVVTELIAVEGGHTVYPSDSPMNWYTGDDDADRNLSDVTFYPDNVQTSIGEHAGPVVFEITVDERRVAMNLLKHFREWSAVVHRLTNGNWTAMETTLASYVPFREFGVRSFSWPAGRVNIEQSKHWDRSTIIHEMSHQLMWVVTGYDIAGDFVSGDYIEKHTWDQITNQLTAYIEGWADFVALVITGTRTGCSSVTEDAWASRPIYVSLTSISGVGDRVEGAFASALLEIFDNYIAPTGSSNSVAESDNGDVLTPTSNAWLNARGLSGPFLNLIWGPLRGMRGRSELSPTVFAEQIARLNSTDGERNWHLLVDVFARYEIRLSPGIRQVSVNTGPASGGTTIDIEGEHFSINSEVFFDAVSVTPTVRDARHLTVISPPATPGAVLLRVVTPAGESFRSIFTYV